MKKRLQKIAQWLRDYEKRLLYSVGIVIVGFSCFVFGVLKGAGLSHEPLTVLRPTSPPIVVACESAEDAASKLTVADCKFVGSIKGKKYYPPSCSYAKNIAKENLRCFTSEEDAEAKGYERTTSCN